jgi:thiol-disulfide isomerase/thioredoxin
MKRILVLLAAAAVAAAGFSQSMMKTAGSTGGTGSMMSANTLTADPAVGSALRMAKSAAKKLPFTSLFDAQALAAKVPVVLFFAADWCPYCQADIKDINANGGRLGIVTIIVVDYDKENDLEQQLGVTVQDTFVQIDAKGMKLGAWNGGGVDMILKRVVKA